MIGVDDQTMTLGTSPSYYKRHILFYDQLLLIHSTSAIRRWRDGSFRPKCRQNADEMEYLLETPYFLSPEKLGDIQVGLAAVYSLRNAEARLRKALPEKAGLIGPHPEFSRFQKLRESLFTRLVAETLTGVGRPAISAHVIPKCAAGASSPMLVAGEVIRLAIDRVMIPDERTSWEDILALKADRDLQDRARKLRLWAIKAAKNETSLAVVDEQIADLLADYERFLRTHRLKYSYMTLGAVITEGAGMLEDLLKLRLGKVAGRFFSASRTKADMTLSELKAPGRELSLVTLANARLQ